MLINLKEMLQAAEQNNCAVGSYNVYNLESILAVKEAVETTKLPAIIAFGESYTAHAPIEAIASIVHTLFMTSTVPVVLHLDHAQNPSVIKQAIDCGFTSVMYDGSRLPLAENIANSQKIVQMAHASNISVEGELGYLNNEDGSGEASASCTDVNDAVNYTEKSGVDALAIAIGNAHGLYKSTPQLNFAQLKKLHENVQCPLVLHGSSGISFADLQKAIDLGIRKFNINTEVSTTGVKALREYLAQNPYEQNPNLRLETVLKYARSQMSCKIAEFMQIFANKEKIK